MNKNLEIKDLELDPALQPRAAIDPATVADYTEVLTDENRVDPWPFPPVSVVFDGQKYWLWDGFHRVQAAQNAGIRRIPATVQEGDRAFALWRSVGANKTHGLRRTNADKRRATEQALLAAPARSDREISYHVGVSPPLVGKIRAELSLTVNIYSQTARTGADGRTINTGNIGSQQPDYVPIWQLEQGVSAYMTRNYDLETGINTLELVKQKHPIGLEFLEKTLLAGETLPGPRRKGDVVQACHNVLDHLKATPKSSPIGEPPQSEPRENSVMCPHCDEVIFIDQDTRKDGSIVCDSCKRKFGSYEALLKAVEKVTIPAWGAGGRPGEPFTGPRCTCKSVSYTRRPDNSVKCNTCGTTYTAPEWAEFESNPPADVFTWTSCPRCNVVSLQPNGVLGSCDVCGWPAEEKQIQPRHAPGSPDPQPDPAPNQFDCPECDEEKVVHVNGGAWCLNCGVKWASAASFRLDLAAYEAQIEHVRNLRELVQAAGGPETAAVVLEVERVRALQVQAIERFQRIVETTIIEDLEALNALLEDFELDTPPED